MISRWKILVRACSVLVAADAAQAQNDDRSDWLQSQFSGWSGIAFHCEISPANSSTAKSLCGWAEQRVRLLGRQSGAQVTVVSSDPFQRVLDKRKAAGRLLDLQLFLRTTIPKGDGVTAVYAALRALPHVAVAKEPATKGSMGRVGSLIMWNRDVIGSGLTGPELELSLQQSIEVAMTQFLNDYADGQR